MDNDIIKTEGALEGNVEIKKEDADEHNVVKSVKEEIKCEVENDPKVVNNDVCMLEDIVDEDVPSDFFDDFMNNEFMEGLDVVDAWDEDEGKEEEKKIKDVGKCKNPPPSPLQKSNDKGRMSGTRERVDSRRDPEKTKRAIAKDKEKCAKDKEAKIINEKLKIVETGLVPPGMETEVDLKEIKKQEALSKEKILNDRSSEKEGKEKSEIILSFGREKPKVGMKNKPNMIRDLREKLPAKKEIRNSREPRFPPGSNSREKRDNVRVNLREQRNVLGRGPRSSIEKREMVRLSREKKEPFNRSSREDTEIDSKPLHEVREANRFRSKSKSTDARLRYYKRKLEERNARLDSEKRLRLRSRSRSYHRGKKSLSRSPRRHPNPTEERHRRRDSPPSRRKSRGGSHFKFSPSPAISEREMWLRHKHRIKGSPPKEPHHGSVIDRRTIGFLEELSDKLKSDELKKSNLYNEIQKQLNEPSKHSSYPHPMHPHIRETAMMGDFIPAPVPPPPQQNFYLPPPPQQRPPEPNLQFDEEFFIGQPTQPFPDPNGSFDPSFSPYQNIPPQQYYNPPHPGNHLNHPLPPPSINFPTFENPNNVNLSPPIVEQRAIITQLFENKKISLSDYLKSISTKTGTDAAETIPLHKKVKVITLCQDVINSIGDDFEGRFFLKHVKKIKQEEKIDIDKSRTPIKKPPVVRFNFTTKSKIGKDRSFLYSTCQKLLATVGLMKSPPPSPPPPPAQNISPIILRKPPTPKKKQPTPIKKPKIEPFKCHTCEKRKTREFTDSGSQCNSEMVSVGTYMTDEDLIRFGSKPMLKGILKNQSLAELTPAQLLSQSSLGGNSTARMNQPHSSEQGFHLSPEKLFDCKPNRSIFPPPNKPIFPPPNKPIDNKSNQLMQMGYGEQYFDFEAPTPRNSFGSFPPRQNNKRGKKRRGKFMQGPGGGGPGKPYYNL